MSEPAHHGATSTARRATGDVHCELFAAQPIDRGALPAHHPAPLWWFEMKSTIPVALLAVLLPTAAAATDTPGSVAKAAQICASAARRQILEAPEDWRSTSVNGQTKQGTVGVLSLVVAGGRFSCTGATVGTSNCLVSGPAVVQVKAPGKTAYFDVPTGRQAKITSGVPDVDPIRCELMAQGQADPETGKVPTKAVTRLAQETPAKSPIKADEDPVVCRSYETTGSRIGSSRACMKRSEWQMRDAQLRGENITKLNQLRGVGPQN